MGDAGFKGTTIDQDSRFGNKEKRLLKSMKFPPEFSQKVNFGNVNLDVIKPWIYSEVAKILGFEDEIVIDYTISLLEEKNADPRKMQINLTGFLEKNAQSFVLDLWKLLISAQDSVGGIPAAFLDQKKEELRQKKIEEERRKAEQVNVSATIRHKKQSEMNDLQASHFTRERRSRFSDRTPSPRDRRRSVTPPPRRRSRSRSLERPSRYERDSRGEDMYGRRSRRRSRDDDVDDGERGPHRDYHGHARRHHRSSSRSRGQESPRRRRRDSPSPRRYSRSSSRDRSRERKRLRSSRDERGSSQSRRDGDYSDRDGEEVGQHR